MILGGVDRAAVLGGSAVGALILAGCVPLAADGPPLGFTRLALVALAAAAAFVLDDPAAAVDAAPRTRRHRTAVRAAAALLPFAIWCGGVMALDQRNGLTPVSALLVEGAGALAIAVALAAGLRLAGRDEPGEIVASLLGAMMLAVLIFNPPPRSVPLFPISAGWAASTALWSCLALLATPVVVITSRDPYRR